MAIRVLRSNGDTRRLGKDWIQKFIRRNPRVASVIGRRIDASRIDGTSQEALQDFYTLFKATETRYHILVDNIWNMDEHGTALGVCTNTRVLSSSKKKRSYQKSPQNREWVSIIETINPNGKVIKPLLHRLYLRQSQRQSSQSYRQKRLQRQCYKHLYNHVIRMAIITPL